MNHDFNRRDMLKATAAGLASTGLTTGLGSWVLAAQEDSPDGIPKRPLGDTGEKVSIIGVGGYHIGTFKELKDSIAMMHEAIDEGVTFFDNAWDYMNGKCEEWMGEALKQGNRREKVFLMTKVCDRHYEGAKQHLEDSLRRLQTDHIDLWQFHEINYPDDPEWVFEKGGLKAALEAQKAGKIRFIGFTGHKDINIHLEMINRGFHWDACQMPINIMDAHYRSFQKEVVPVCVGRKIGVVGMKGLAGGALVRDGNLSAIDCRRYALSLPVSTLVCGMASRENLQQDVAVARGFQPMSDEEMQAFLAKTRSAGSMGQLERFKTTRGYDGRYHQQQHRTELEDVG
ncbi:MAG: aldo/keto reductase [Planctomycetota bacterium]